VDQGILAYLNPKAREERISTQKKISEKIRRVRREKDGHLSAFGNQKEKNWHEERGATEETSGIEVKNTPRKKTVREAEVWGFRGLEKVRERGMTE